MRRFWIAGAVCLALSGASAHARDKAAAPSMTAPSWSGVYFGPTLGWAFGSSQGDYTGFVPPPPAPMIYYPFNINPNGATLGGQIGYNIQIGAWVFGLEGDWSWVFNASDRGFDTAAGSNRYDDVTLLWTGHARGRVGYLFSQFLVFFSGGAAFAGTQAAHYAPDGGGANWFDTRLLTGYSLGGGIETFMTSNWIFRIEYLHDHFGSEHYDWVVGSRYSNADLTLDIVRISLIFRP